MRTVYVSCIALLLFGSMPVMAQQSDVTFFVIGKHANFDQQENGARTVVDFSFFSEIFLTTDGNAERATLRLPSGEKQLFVDKRLAEGGEKDNLLLVSGEARYKSYDDLQARYPDGRYRISFRTPSGGKTRANLNFPSGGLPDAPAITLKQAGSASDVCVDASKPVKVSWSKFERGGVDPNGILDDLIFAILTNSDGVRVAHSGRPFEGKKFLTYADTGFTIPETALEPNSSYVLSVEHAILNDTQLFDSVPAMTTRAVTTRLTVFTKGENSDNCEAAMPIPAINSQTVMFYYKDLASPARFYGETLGLKNTLDWDWAKLFETSPGASVGLIREGEGAFHKVQSQNAVMLSLVSTEIEAWYERLQKTDVKFLKPLKTNGSVRSFLLEDPGGYAVEFYELVER